MCVFFEVPQLQRRELLFDRPAFFEHDSDSRRICLTNCRSFLQHLRVKPVGMRYAAVPPLRSFDSAEPVLPENQPLAQKKETENHESIHPIKSNRTSIRFVCFG